MLVADLGAVLALLKPFGQPSDWTGSARYSYLGDKDWIPVFAEKHPSHWKEMLGGNDGRRAGMTTWFAGCTSCGEVFVSCYTFLETGIGWYHALGLPWTRQR